MSKRRPLPFPWPTGSFEEETDDGFTLVSPPASDEDMARYEAALETDPDAREVREFYAHALHRRGLTTEALANWRILVEADPENEH